MMASFYRLLFTCCLNGVGGCCTGTLGHVIEDMLPLIVFLCIKMKEKEKDAHIHFIPCNFMIFLLRSYRGGIELISRQVWGQRNKK